MAIPLDTPPSMVDIKPPTTFLLIRHGETDENIKKLMQGQRNTLLNTTGKSQAKELALRISEHYPKINQIYSSDLERALFTAKIAAEQLCLEVIQDISFKEVSWGIVEGIPIKDVEPLRTQESLQAKTWRERWSYPYFQDAEPYNVAMERVKKGLATIAEKSPGETIAIFTHSRIIKILMEDALDTESTPELKNCGIARFTYSSSQEENRLKFEELVHLIQANH